MFPNSSDESDSEGRMMVEEKRRFSRIIFNVAAELTVGDKVFKVASLTNLSVGGCQLEIGEKLPLGSECQVVIVLNPLDRAMNVEVAGEIVRSDGSAVGLKFTSITLDSLHHLQNIIRYNASDPDRIDEEIEIHPGLL